MIPRSASEYDVLAASLAPGNGGEEGLGKGGLVPNSES